MSETNINFFISDCGQFIARRTNSGCIGFNVMALDGSQCWLDRRYEPKEWQDPDPRYTHPEFEHEVLAYSLVSSNRRGEVTAFEIGFADLDQSKAIDPGKGNCVVKNYSARFSRPMKMRRYKPIKGIKA